MSEARRNVLVGGFVLTGLAALGTLVVLFGRDQLPWLAGERYTLNVRFEKATGIRRGTQATVGGLVVGRVMSVGFADADSLDEGVIVGIAFDQLRALHRGTRAKTVEPGLGMGRPPIEIVPGPADEPALASGALVDGDITTAMESLIPPEILSILRRSATQIGGAAEALTPVLEDLHGVLEPRTPEQVDRVAGPPGNLPSAVARLDDSFKHFNAVFGDPQIQDRLKDTVNNFYAMSQDGRQVIDDLKTAAAQARVVTDDATKFFASAEGTLSNFDQRVDEAAQSWQVALDLAARLLAQLNGIASKIDSGDGSLGRLVNDGKLYESMVLTFRRLADATEDLRLVLQDWQAGGIKMRW